MCSSCYREFFGREGDVFDSFEGVRTQWVFAGIDGDLLLGVERRSFGSAKARAAHIVAFLALNKVSQERILSAPATKLQMKTHDSALQKDVRNRQSNLLVTRALSTSEKASNIEKFISVWMNEGLEIALREFGANVNKSNFWSDALHKTIGMPILCAHLVALANLCKELIQCFPGLSRWRSMIRQSQSMTSGM